MSAVAAANYAAAFIDGEGSVHGSSTARMIEAANTDLALLEHLKTMLAILGIESRIKGTVSRWERS